MQTRTASSGDETKRHILQAALSHVHTCGWSDEAIDRGVLELGYPAITGRILSGPSGLIEAFLRDCNNRLPGATKASTSVDEELLTSPHADVELLRLAMQVRLEMLIPYMNHWPEALAVMALPNNAVGSAMLLVDSVDAICAIADSDGDSETARFQRRAMTTAVYSATELYMMRDSSAGYEDTWDFMDRRLADLIALESKLPQVAQEGVAGLFKVAKNVLGLPQTRT